MSRSFKTLAFVLILVGTAIVTSSLLAEEAPAPTPPAQDPAAQNPPAPAPEQTPRTKAMKPKLAVRQIEGDGLKKGTAEALTEIVCAELTNLGTFNVLCASDVAALLKSAEQSALMGDCDDETCMQKLSSVLKAQYIITGAVGKVEKNTVISLSLLTREGQVIKRVTQDAAAGDLTKAMREAAGKLLK
ncbi:MAG: hypothetical protein C4523_03145 [Myxococcales bacterium]|nr:MAG: hypothetical protein C4523_03145 [Myxococcales bacterium]